MCVNLSVHVRVTGQRETEKKRQQTKVDYSGNSIHHQKCTISSQNREIRIGLSNKKIILLVL